MFTLRWGFPDRTMFTFHPSNRWTDSYVFLEELPATITEEQREKDNCEI